MARVSPTRIMSARAPSTVRAVGASYAVIMTSGAPSPLRAAIAGAVTRGVAVAISIPPPSRAPMAPGGDRQGIPGAAKRAHGDGRNPSAHGKVVVAGPHGDQLHAAVGCELAEVGAAEAVAGGGRPHEAV